MFNVTVICCSIFDNLFSSAGNHIFQPPRLIITKKKCMCMCVREREMEGCSDVSTQQERRIH